MQTPVFLLNSRLGRFSAASFPSGSRRPIEYQRLPFSRSYGDILPSSFSTDHSSTLGFSPRLPVSVYGTVGCETPARGFSWRPASRTLCGAMRPLRRPVSRIGYGIYLAAHATPLHRHSIIRRFFCFRVPPCGDIASHPARESSPVSHRLRLAASA